MLKFIILGAFFWFLWRQWKRFLRETIARINMTTAQMHPASQTSSQDTASMRPDTSGERRVVLCERCGVHVPLNEVYKLPSHSSDESPRYTCIQPCSPSDTTSTQ